MLLAVIPLSGCILSGSPEEKTVGDNNSSLENYNAEMLAAALEEHPDFPALNPGEPAIEEVEVGEDTVTIKYSSEIELRPHEAVTVTDPDSGKEVWSEATSSDYFITLVKTWETDEGTVKNFWKYKYNPQKDEVSLVEEKNNADKVSQ